MVIGRIKEITADPNRVTVIVSFSDGKEEALTFGTDVTEELVKDTIKARLREHEKPQAYINRLKHLIDYGITLEDGPDKKDKDS